MKTFLSLVSLGVAVVGLLQAPAAAQYEAAGYPTYMQGGPQTSVAPFQTQVPFGWPGNVWVEANVADSGLGYNGSYVTVGGKSRLFEDFLGGRWVSQLQGHMSLESGGFFSNMGVERVFTVEAAETDVFVGVWWDYDDDQQGDFAHTFNQVALSGGFKSELFDLYGNGYLPSGNTNYTQGDITGNTVFLNNSIVTQVGIDSALEGFDVHITGRPPAWGFLNTSVDLGTYVYGSDTVDTFSGISLGGGIQTLRGMAVNVQVNHDNRFDWTGVLQFAWQFGARGAPTEYSPLGRDLEPTQRNDHIVRFQQDTLLAIDPDTGTPYVVFHVDNTAAAGGDGSYERPFRTLAEAQAASGAHNVIFVHQGDGTSTGMDSGIVLKDGQLFLGNGIVHTIPELRLGTFDVFDTINGLQPEITNLAGNAITLANDNTVRNFDINGAAGNMTNGIFGAGDAFNPLVDGIIEDVTIRGNPVLNGIDLNFISGDWRFARNNISTAGNHGIGIDNVQGASSTLTFLQNTVTTSSVDGIHIEDYNGRRFVFRGNEVSNNIGDGVEMLRYNGTNGTWLFDNHTGDGNIEAGIQIQQANGQVTIQDSTLSNNSQHGVELIDVNNTLGSQTSLIDNVTLSGNGTGLTNILNTGTQQLVVTNSNVDGNGLGIRTLVNGIGTALDLDIVDNVSISNNSGDAIRVVVDTGGSVDFLLQNDPASPLIMDSNANLSGIGIVLLAQGSGAGTSSINSIIRGLDITNNGDGIPGGIFVSAIDDSVSQTFIEDVNISGPSDSIITFFETNNALLNTLVVNRSTVGSFNNTVQGTTHLDMLVTDVTATGVNGLGLFSMDTAGTSLTRLNLYDSTFSNNTLGDGVRVSVNGNSQVLATVLGVTANNNGRAPLAGENSDTLTPWFAPNGADIPNGDFNGTRDQWHGFNFNSGGNGHLALTLLDNDAHGNFEQGLAMYTDGSGRIDAVIERNRLTLNDVGTDGDSDLFPPDQEIGSEDAVFVNFSGDICVALSTNFFANDAYFGNLAGPANFVVELDGVSNQVPPIFVGGAGNFNVQPFGAVCQPNIDALEAIFTGAGFP